MNDVVVVTGAADGIGRAVATRLAGAGCTVIAVDLDGPRLTELCESTPNTVAVTGDVADGHTMRQARRAGELAGRLSGWVNNAAIVRMAALHEVDDDEIDRIMAVNLRAVVVGTRCALHAFLDAGTPGSIVNVSSIHAHGGFPGYALYDTCKGGVEALTRYVCVEYGHLGIRCNAVAPGAVATPSSERLRAAAGDPDQALAATREMAPMRRISSPDEIAHAVGFLLDSGSVAVNGHILAVDNGMAARGSTLPSDSNIDFRRTVRGDHRRSS